jgi:hypothetical protein
MATPPLPTPPMPPLGISDQIRLWIPVIITVFASLIAASTWIQNNGNDKFMTKESGENLKEKMADMKIDMQQIKNQNVEIIQRLTAIDSKVEKK